MVISSKNRLRDTCLWFSFGKRSHRHRCIEPKEEYTSMASQTVLVVENLPESAGDAGNLGSSLGSKDPLEEKMAAHSTILAWEISWTEDLGGLQSMGSQESDMIEVT